MRLPYGVTSAPGIYQRIMEKLLHNTHMTCVYLDDILVSGSTPEEHDRYLRTVFTRLLDKGLRLRKEDCVFRQTSCRYVGHIIDEEGIRRPIKDKVMSTQNAPVLQLLSYIGLIHYYHNVGTVTQPDTKWKWDAIPKNAFEQSKAPLF